MISPGRIIVRRLLALLRLYRQSRLLARSGLFDAAWYRRQMPGRRIGNAALHYLRRGAVEGLDPGPAFDGAAYLKAHEDVELSATNPLLHFLMRGQAERRAIFLAGTSPRQQLAPIASQMPHGCETALTPTGTPLVSVIIPSRDHAGLLARCVHGILHRTAYQAVEIIIVDNASRTRRAKNLLRNLAREPGIRVLAYPEKFNWSAMNNHAARHARGLFLVLLNNDVLVRDPRWLGEMLALAEHPDTGAVGAKLLYPGGTIQHAGISLGRRALASHLFRHANAENPGPFGMLARRREVAAVTGACLVLRRDLFDAVGGLEEAHLGLTNGDVDLCLRLRARGKKIIWTPHAVLTHAEAATRGLDFSPIQIARGAMERKYLLATWGTLAETDPTLPPGCVVAGERLMRVLPRGDRARQMCPPTHLSPGKPGNGPILGP